MPFIPHTEAEIKAMLQAIGVANIEDLYREIPSELRCKSFSGIPEGLNEYEIKRFFEERLKKDKNNLCFMGAGAYEHHIPALIFDLISRGEFYTAYTPYQAEASQGNLQVIYEYQTMIANLTGMEAANASVYDGSCALAESILMAIRLNKTAAKKILMPRTVHPHHRNVVENIVSQQNIEIVAVDYLSATGQTPVANLKAHEGEAIAAVVIPQPNFFGTLEEVDQLTDWAHEQGALVIALVNPMALALLKEPGKWGKRGADIACGEGQPLGIPLQSGGPYFGFMACKLAYIRQMPGRIVGRTTDQTGKEGFTLTLQAREQHIRRSKATSNICTNQGLMVTAATIYMSLLGAEGLKRVAAKSHDNARSLLDRITQMKGVEKRFKSPFFHECVVHFKHHKASEILNGIDDQFHIQAGYDLSQHYPELGQSILVCATETKSEEDLLAYQNSLQAILNQYTKEEIYST